MLKHACILRPLHLLRLAVSAAGGGGVRRLALPLPFRTAAACVGADALHRPASLRHRKAHGTMQASSPTKHKAKPCRALQDISLRKAAMHPSVCALRRITGLRYPHHAAHAEACLHSATAAPAPSRFLRRRRRSTPQPLTGEPFKRQRPAKPPLQGEVPPQAAEGCGAWPCHYPFGPPQRKNSPAPGLWVRGCFSGMRAGRLGVSGRRIPGCLSPKQRLPGWRAEHWPGHWRRHRAATADAAPPEFVPPPRCRPPAA